MYLVETMIGLVLRLTIWVHRQGVADSDKVMVWLLYVDMGVYDWMMVYVDGGFPGFGILRDGLRCT